MNIRKRFSIAACCTALAVAAMMSFGSTTASAVPWACANTTVINNCPFVVGVCPNWAPALVPPCTPFLAAWPGPGNVVVIPTAAAANLFGMISLGGFPYGFAPLPATPCVPAPFWVPNFIIGPGPGNCVDVYVNPGACTITVCPALPAPPPCRP